MIRWREGERGTTMKTLGKVKSAALRGCWNVWCGACAAVAAYVEASGAGLGMTYYK
jgi:hypothetical protein